jgi:glutamyl-tRNA synthetase
MFINPESKKNINEHIKYIKKAVKEINKLSLEEQKELFLTFKEKKHDISDQHKKRKWVNSLPSLSNAKFGKVVTRFPPEPNGFLHIGHAKAAIIDYSYSKKYNGKFILRFDDTDPTKEKIEYYNAQKNDLKWLGITWDIEYKTSDNLNCHYKYAKELISKGFAYVCGCPSEKIKDGRRNKKICECRKKSSNTNLKLWEDMFSSKPGTFILRLKGRMNSNNTAMRDPTLFRILDTPHPIQGNKYRVWPTYDMAGPIEDSTSGVTHPFRTKEYELRDEVYYYLLDCLGLRKPLLIEFSRLEIEGLPTSKRKLRTLISSKKVEGWDDPRLPTLIGLQRRGIRADTIKTFILKQGISKTESKYDISLFESINKKIIDPISKRFFFVHHPKMMKIEGASIKEIILKNHPQKNLGTRKISIDDTFYISSFDFNKLKKGDIFRLKDLYNVKIIKKKNVITGKYISENNLK